MEGPLPSLNVSSGVSNGPQEPQPDGRQQARKSTVPRGVRFNASNESLGDGQKLAIPNAPSPCCLLSMLSNEGGP